MAGTASFKTKFCTFFKAVNQIIKKNFNPINKQEFAMFGN